MSTEKYDILRTESGEYETTLNRMFRGRKPWRVSNPGHILSFMPGTVEAINVEVGQKVSEGQSLMIFRAMKMNNDILASFAGKVAKIGVKSGENVAKDVVMIELE